MVFCPFDLIVSTPRLASRVDPVTPGAPRCPKVDRSLAYSIGGDNLTGLVSDILGEG
jgi:hypothetical protein